VGTTLAEAKFYGVEQRMGYDRYGLGQSDCISTIEINEASRIVISGTTRQSEMRHLARFHGGV
jgi:hypothetical protein